GRHGGPRLSRHAIDGARHPKMNRASFNEPRSHPPPRTGNHLIALRSFFAGFHMSSGSRDPERNVSLSAPSSMNSVLLNASTMARSLSLCGGAQSFRVRATSLMATRFSARSLTVALNVLQPVEPDSCLSMSVRDAGLFLRVLKP